MTIASSPVIVLMSVLLPAPVTPNTAMRIGSVLFLLNMLLNCARSNGSARSTDANKKGKMNMNSAFNKLELLDRIEDILAHHRMSALTHPYHLDGQSISLTIVRLGVLECQE